MNREEHIPAYVVKMATALLSLLMAGNIFFVVRLVEKVDNTESQVIQLRFEVAALQSAVQQLSVKKSNWGPHDKNRTSRSF